MSIRLTDVVLFGNGPNRADNRAFATVLANGNGSAVRYVMDWCGVEYAQLVGQYDGKVLATLTPSNGPEDATQVGAMVTDLLGQAGITG